MSEKNLNNINKVAYSDDKPNDKDKLQHMLRKSILLNTDIFSSEFEEEVIEESLEKIVNEKKEDIVNETNEDADDLTNQEIKMDFGEESFILSVEKNNEETVIQRSKREFNESMRKEKNTNIKLNKNDNIQMYIHQVKRAGISMTKFKNDFDFTKESLEIKKYKVIKKNTLFNFNETYFENIPQREFSIGISKEKQDQFSMDLNKKENIQTLIKKEKDLKFEVFQNE